MVFHRVLTGAGVLGASAALLAVTAGVAGARPAGDTAIWSAPSVPIGITIHTVNTKCYSVHGVLGEKANYLANRTKSSVLSLFSEPNCGGGMFIDAIFPPGTPGNSSESHKEYYSFSVNQLNSGS